MRPRRLVPILAATGIALALPLASAHAAVVNLKPSQDTYVDAKAPSRAQGGAKALRLTARPARRGFLRFDLRHAEGALTKATLGLYLTGSKGGRVKVSRVAAGQSWSERATTYSNAPTASAAGAVRSKAARRRGWLEVDVTGLIALGGLSDLALSGSPAAVVGSRESARSPRVVLELSSPPVFTPGPPTPPTITGAPPSVPPPANVAPVDTLRGAGDALEGQTKTYTYTVSGPNPTLTESCGANAVKIDTPASDSFDCTFADGPASSTVSVSANDGDAGGSDQLVVSIANVAPTVTLSGAGAADEGQTKTYTYTVSDPGTDPNPTLTESCGANGTKTDTPDAHSFECTFPDGPADSTVTVTAADGDDIGSDQRVVTVANVAPTVTLSGPGAADEGQTKTYTYTVTDPGTDPNPTITESCGANGVKTDTPATHAFDCTFPDGPADSTVTVTADDGDAGESDQPAVTVDNVAPVLTLPASQDLDGGTERIFDLGSFEDPGAADGPWAVAVDWGDGSEPTTFEATSTGALGTQDHIYPDAGVYPVTVSVTDKDGGTDSKVYTIPDAASVTIIHDSAPDSAQDFEFSVANADGEPIAEFVLDDDADPEHASRRTFTYSTGTEPGFLSITGSAVEGWTQADIFCDGDEDAFSDVETHYAEVIVDPGEHIECRFWSERDATLTVVHDARPDSGQDFSFTVAGRQPGSFTLDDDDDPALADRKVFTVSGRRFGNWAISAGEVDGWGRTDLSCTGDSEAEVIDAGTVELDIDIGETIECRFVQSRDASVTIVHDTQPDSDQDFEFVTAGVQLRNFTLDDDIDPTKPAQEAFTVSASGFGAKTISQAAVAGWSLAELSCTGDPESAQHVAQRSVDLVVDPGEVIACRFVSRRTGDVGGVYPESSSFIGPFRDGNGNLYTLTEVTAADPRPVIRKSTDGGRTWNEVDGANRPSHNDLESVWMVQDGTRIHVLHQRSGTYRVSYHSFNTSDAPSSPDSWQVKNEVVHLPAATTLPDNQAVSLVQRSNGDLLAFYRTDRSGPDAADPQRVAWRTKATGASGWGSETIVDSTPGKSFTQVAAVRGANDKVHIFYKNDTDSAVWHRSLNAEDALSDAEAVNDSPTTTDDHTMINPAYVDAAGTERVTIAWKRASGGALVGALIEDDGTPQAEEVISDIPVYEDPARVGSFQPVAALAADQATQKIHAVYSANATHDLWADTRNGGWGVDVPVLESTEAEIVSSNVFSHSAGNGGQKVIGTVFDVNTGLVDNEVFYTEFPLGG